MFGTALSKIRFFLQKRPKGGVFYFVLFGLSLVLAAGLTGLAYYRHLVQVLPEPTVAAMRSAPQSSRILDRNGELLFEIYGDVKRRPVALDQIPQPLQAATIAIEDKDFYDHSGFDLSGILRAFWVNLKNREIKQGASTLTQQFARTVFLSREKTYSRKFKELVLATRIERRYPKNKILEYYLNNTPYGSNAYGVAAASKYYYDKPVRDLNVQECIYLAALPKAPGRLDPFGANTDKLEARAELVIKALHEQGFLSSAGKKHYLSLGRPEFVKSPIRIKAPHFVFYVLDELKKRYDVKELYSGGLDIRTSLDMELQQTAEQAIADWGAKNQEKYKASNAALVALDPGTGEILSMVGSRNFFQDKYGAFNVAVNPRPPGSSFKPYVYAAAISKEMTPNTVLMDTWTNFAPYNHGERYVPRNYNGRFYGPVTVRKALAGSLNIPAVKALVRTGVNEVVNLAEEMGITSLKPRQGLGPALALGSGDVSLLEHTGAMAVFAASGMKHQISPVLSITDPQGRTVYRKTKGKGRSVLNRHVAYWINDMLSDARARRYIFGYHNPLEIPGRQVAAKTGTSQDYRDAWTVGYTPDLAVGVWVGNNDFSPMKKGAYGSAVAGPIWHQFMSEALAGSPTAKFAKPDDLPKLPPPVYPRVAKDKKDKTEGSADDDKADQTKKNNKERLAAAEQAEQEAREPGKRQTNQARTKQKTSEQTPADARRNQSDRNQG